MGCSQNFLHCPNKLLGDAFHAHLPSNLNNCLERNIAVVLHPLRPFLSIPLWLIERLDHQSTSSGHDLYRGDTIDHSELASDLHALPRKSCLLNIFANLLRRLFFQEETKSGVCTDGEGKLVGKFWEHNRKKWLTFEQSGRGKNTYQTERAHLWGKRGSCTYFTTNTSQNNRLDLTGNGGGLGRRVRKGMCREKVLEVLIIT